MSSAYVRTLPHYMPAFRAWRPVIIQILVCDSQCERVSVVVTVDDVEARFGWPFGSRSIELTVLKDVSSTKDVCTGYVIIWPRASGKPKLLLTSPEATFPSSLIETREVGAFSASLQSLDNKGESDSWTYRWQRTKTITRKAVGAAIGGAIPYLLCGLTLNWLYSDIHTSTASSNTLTRPEIIHTDLSTETQMKAAIPTPTGCTFWDPMGEGERRRSNHVNTIGQEIVLCDFGTFFTVATATYQPGGSYEFQGFTPYTP